MYTRLVRSKRLVPAILGTVTLAGVALCCAWDALPRLLPSRKSRVLAAFSLAMIAVAYLVYQIAHRPPAMELAEGDSAGGGLSFLGGQPVLAESAAGDTVQRHCDRAVRSRCVSGDCWLAANVAGQLLRRNLFRVRVRHVAGDRAARKKAERSWTLTAPCRRRELARQTGRHEISCEYPNFWYARRQQSGGSFPSVALVTTDFLFRRLQI